MEGGGCAQLGVSLDPSRSAFFIYSTHLTNRRHFRSDWNRTRSGETKQNHLLTVCRYIKDNTLSALTFYIV